MYDYDSEYAFQLIFYKLNWNFEFEFKYWAGITADVSRAEPKNYNNDNYNYINNWMITVLYNYNNNIPANL